MKKFVFPIICCIAFGLLIEPYIVFSENVGGNKEEIDLLNKRITEKQSKIKEIEESIEQVRKQITQKRTEAVSLSNQLSLLDTRILQFELDIKVNENRLDVLTYEIERLEGIIQEKTEDITRQRKILGEFIRTIHQDQNKNFVEIVAAYDNFSEFYTTYQNKVSIGQDLGNSARALRIANEELDTRLSQKEDKQQNFLALREELKEKKLDLEDQAFVKENVLARTQSSELQFKALQTSLKQKAQEIENEIAGIEQEVRRRLEAENKIDNNTAGPSGPYLWPVPSKYVTAYFHDPNYPYRHVFEHNAIDIRAGQGTPIRAAASGYVARARSCSSASCYAYTVLVHNGGMSTVYGHMSKIIVSPDQFVARGEVIGYSGGTPGTVGAGPFVTGPHLHFEVRKNGIPVNPLAYLEN